MASASILHVGEDTCFRIPVMEKAGLVVCSAACSIDGIRGAFEGREKFSALTFQPDGMPIPLGVLEEARSYRKPLILFERPAIPFDRQFFDVVIPNHTPPQAWLKCLELAINDAMRLGEYSRQLREEAAAVRYQTQELRGRLHQLIAQPIDVDGIWRIGPESSPPLAMQPGRKGKKR